MGSHTYRWTFRIWNSLIRSLTPSLESDFYHENFQLNFSRLSCLRTVWKMFALGCYIQSTYKRYANHPQTPAPARDRLRNASWGREPGKRPYHFETKTPPRLGSEDHYADKKRLRIQGWEVHGCLHRCSCQKRQRPGHWRELLRIFDRLLFCSVGMMAKLQNLPLWTWKAENWRRIWELILNQDEYICWK